MTDRELFRFGIAAKIADGFVRPFADDFEEVALLLVNDRLPKFYFVMHTV